MRQALEMALDWIKKQPEETPHSKYDVDTRYVVIREIEAALAQPERDYERGFIDGMQKQMQSSVDKAVNRMAQPDQDWIERERAVGYREGHQNALKQMAQPEQEPVAYIHRNEFNEYRLEPTDNFKITDLPVGVEMMLYTTPPQRKKD